MRCTSFSTATAYDIPCLFREFQKIGKVDQYRGVIHRKIQDLSTEKDIFYFSYGVVVLWGFSEEEERLQLSTLKEFETEPLLEIEFDEMSFSYGEKGAAEKKKISDDHILLPDKKSLTKLSISYGVAQSAQLATFEKAIQKTIDQSQQIPKELAKRGNISLSRKETSKKMGEIFIERNFINLHTEIFDTPEFFWEHPELEKFYVETIRYLDVGKRIEMLNKRLDILHELYEILSNQINHQHSSRLEIIIIILIFFEVVFSLMRDLFHLL